MTVDQIEKIQDLFSNVGYCQRVDEKYLDVITGLSGCGPSYVRYNTSYIPQYYLMEYNMQMYIICEALADGGVKAGLPKELAVKLVAQTMLVSSV